MVKEEKTIDGFPVRDVKDSRLVSKSKAKKLNQNKKLKAKNVLVVSGNDPLVSGGHKKSTQTNRQQKKAIKKTAARMTDIRPAKHTKATKSPKRIVVSETHEEEVRSEEKELERAQAHEDFLAPVETFGFSEEAKETDEGLVEEVETEEVVEIKKSKKALKEAKKQAEKERKELKKQAKKKSKAGKVVKIILLVLLVLFFGAGAYLYFWGNSLIKKMTGGEGDVWSAIGAITKETYEPLKTDGNGRTNILVYGTSGYNMSGETSGGAKHDGSQLTDSIMVVSIDQETGDMAMVSLPRDLKAGYTCTATGKVNEVYWCAMLNSTDEADGARALQAKIAEILGIDTQYYVHMNWGALVSIVDTLGGVTVTLDEDINDRNWTGAVYRAGETVTLNGEQALGLARARHGTAYGDFTRGNSQQKILIGIKNKVVEKGLGLTEALSILSALGDNLRTNLNMEEIKTGMNLLEKFDIENIRQIALVGEDSSYMTTANIDGISYVVPRAGVNNYGVIQEYVRRMLSSNPTEREGAEILVLNGTGESGVAAEEKARLEKRGYSVKEIANAPEGEYSYDEDIEVYDTSEGAKPETKVALEKFYGVEMKSEAELPNGISGVGYDFIIIVGDSSLE